MKRSSFLRLLSLLLFTALVPFLRAAEENQAHDFAKWEKEIAAFEAADKTNPPPKDVIVFTGSSTIRMWKTLAQDFPKYHVLNRGFGGCQIEDCTHFADRIIFPYKPGMIVLRAGGNDLWAGKTPERVFTDFKAFVSRIREKLPETEIVFLGMSPSIARWKQAPNDKAANVLIEDFIKDSPRVQYVDTYTVPLDASGQPRPEVFIADKLHFNEAGYKLLMERVRTVLP